MNEFGATMTSAHLAQLVAEERVRVADATAIIGRLAIRTKLGLLAGVPVAGALVLAGIIALQVPIVGVNPS